MADNNLPAPTKIDKRRVTAKENLKKAREIKLKKLKDEKNVRSASEVNQKPKYEYKVVEDLESSDSEDEYIVVSGKKGKKKIDANQPVATTNDKNIQEQLKEMQEILANLTVKKKNKNKKKSNVIKVVHENTPIIQTPNKEIDELKKKILIKLQ